MAREATQSSHSSPDSLPNTSGDLARQLVDRTKELEALNAVAAAVSQCLDLDQVLNNALDAALEVTEAEVGGIYLLDEKVDLLRVRALRGFSAEFAAAINGLKPGEGYSGRVIQTGRPMLVKDVSQDERLSGMLEWKSDLYSTAIVPLDSKSNTLGVMFVSTESRHELTDQDFQLLTSIGHQIGVAIENARLYEAEQRRAEHFRLIGEVSRRIASILDTNELLSQLVSLIRETLGYSIVGIGLVEGEDLVFRAAAGPSWKLPISVRIKADSGVTGWVIASGKPLLVPDVSLEPRFVSTGHSPPSRSELAVPIKTKDGVIGVINVESKHLNAFDESDRIVLEALSSQAAVAIENARLYEQARQLAALEERHRLARDLHDSVTQALYGVTLYTEAAAGQLSIGNARKVAEHLDVLRETAQEALAEMRLLIYELRPPVLEQEGLVAALQARLLAVEGRVGLKTRLRVEDESRLPSDVEEGLYRIAQEALNNALKHAHAHNITVSLHCGLQGPGVSLEIADDGEGFDLEIARGRGGLGLSTMEGRATELGGQLTIRSRPGEGTRVLVEVPV